MNEINAVPLMQENHPILRPALSENEDSAVIPGASVPSREAAASTGIQDGHEPYERGMALKNAGLFRQAAEHFEKAAAGSSIHAKGFRSNGPQPQEKRKTGRGRGGFSSCPASTLNIVKRTSADPLPLGRTLESLDRIPEALETYRWLRREAPHYRDVAMRIESLEHETNAPRESLTLSTTDVADVARLSAKGKVTLRTKVFSVVGYEPIR